MARQFMSEIYTRFRFYLQTERKNLEFGCQSCFTDPFTGDLWIGAAHQHKKPSLSMLVSEENEIRVWLLAHAGEQGPCRLLRVKFDGFDYLPLDLDARESKVAMEWVRLKNCTYMAPTDVSFENLPAEVAAEVDPRRRTEKIG